MCLKKGTPYRLYQALTQGVDYPDDCNDSETLRGWLNDEWESGCYDDPDLFSPHLRVLLGVFAHRYDLIEPKRREPYYPDCDLIQGLAFTFGIFDTMSKWFPVHIQNLIAEHGLGRKEDGTSIIGSTCYTSARALWRAAEPEFRADTQVLYARWGALGGAGNMLSEFAFRNPDIMDVTPYREVRAAL